MGGHFGWRRCPLWSHLIGTDVRMAELVMDRSVHTLGTNYCYKRLQMIH
jgi:hypothetical protein